jgi:hypothetical protein
MALLLVAQKAVYAQVPDSLRVMRDTTAPAPSEKIPVLSDTTQINDTTIVHTPAGPDTLVKKKVFSPRQATIRSAIIPGWGQVYNKKYWKLPLVYGAIGFPMYLFFDNKKWYDKTKYALTIVANNRQSNADSMARVDPKLQAFVLAGEQGSLLNYRNEFRRDMDYSILFTLLMYGLNIVDATVDAHLKGFDVGEDLTFKIKPSLLGTTMGPGVSLVVNFK